MQDSEVIYQANNGFIRISSISSTLVTHNCFFDGVLKWRARPTIFLMQRFFKAEIMGQKNFENHDTQLDCVGLYG